MASAAQAPRTKSPRTTKQKSPSGQPADQQGKIANPQAHEHQGVRKTVQRRTIWSVEGDTLKLNFHPGQVEAWNALERFVVVLAGTQGGKCEPSSALILLANGTRKSIKDMNIGDEVILLGEDLKVRKSTVTNHAHMGVKPTFRVTTTTGRHVDVTAEHPLYSVDGWKPTGQFSVGDFIGVPRVLPDLGTEDDIPERLRLLGYLLGDGGTSHTTSSVMFTSASDTILEDVQKCLPEGYALNHASRYDYRIINTQKKNFEPNQVIEWTKEWGIRGCLAKEKRMPTFVFALKKSSIRYVLNAFFACDGWIDNRGFGIKLASEQLIDDVQHLLLRFGIIARKRLKISKRNGKSFQAWELFVRDREQLRILADEIGILGKQEKLEQLIAKKEKDRPNTKDLVPTFDIEACWKILGKPGYKQSHRDQVGYNLLRACRRENVSRPFAQSLANHFGVGHDDAYSDIFWDKVKSIEPLGEQDTWDIEVADGHNFIANDIFCHNTSWGPWWLYREIMHRGPGDYLAVTASFELFKLKMLPVLRETFENLLGIGRYWAGAGVIEICNPEGVFLADRQDGTMWARIMLRSAASPGGLESSTANAAWLDEAGQSTFSLQTWEAVLRRLSIAQGRVLITTTIYNLGWLKTNIYDRWVAGDKNYHVIHFPSWVNPSFPKEEFRRAKASMQEHRFKFFYEGIFAQPPGQIYKLPPEQRIPPFMPGDRWPRYLGVDFGGVNNAVVWLAHDEHGAAGYGNDVYFLYRTEMLGDQTTNDYAQKIKTYPDFQWLVTGYGGSGSEEQQRRDWSFEGVPMMRPPFTAVEPGIDRVHYLIRNKKLFVFNNQERFLWEMDNYKRKTDDNGNTSEQIEDKKSYHFLDALRYVAAGQIYYGIDIQPIESIFP